MISGAELTAEALRLAHEAAVARRDGDELTASIIASIAAGILAGLEDE